MKKKKKLLQTAQTIQIQKKTLTEQIKDIFRKHIGLSNGITKKDILVRVFGYSILEEPIYYREYIWRKILSAMKRLRKKTKFFIISQEIESKTLFFVVKSKEEAVQFENRTKKIRSGIRQTERRCWKAVEQKWWKTLD